MPAPTPNEKFERLIALVNLDGFKLRLITALRELETKVKELEIKAKRNSNYKKASEHGQRLRDELFAHANEHLFRELTDTESPEDVIIRFKEACEASIQAAKPILEQHRTVWGKILYYIANIVLNIVTFGCASFFNFRKAFITDSAEKLTLFEEGLNSNFSRYKKSRTPKEGYQEHKNSLHVIKALRELNNVNLLTQENFDIVRTHANPPDLSDALWELNDVNLLTQENFDAVVRRADSDPSDIAYALISLDDAHLLTQANRDALLDNHYLCSTHAYHNIWHMPARFWTQQVFDQLIERAQQADPEEQVRQLHDQLLGVVYDDDVDVGPNIINQDTHHASVHRSVSDSATKLLNRYGSRIDEVGLNKIIREVKVYVTGLPKEPKNEAAKRCIDRITSDTFTDPRSGVTIKQLLALTYLAIHDDGERLSSLDDAKVQFIEGLYEIQRGYNLSEKGVDLGGPDHPICGAGAFNKIIEKLQGIHPNCEIQYITQQTAPHLNYLSLYVKKRGAICRSY